MMIAPPRNPIARCIIVVLLSILWSTPASGLEALMGWIVPQPALGRALDCGGVDLAVAIGVSHGTAARRAVVVAETLIERQQRGGHHLRNVAAGHPAVAVAVRRTRLQADLGRLHHRVERDCIVIN